MSDILNLYYKEIKHDRGLGKQETVNIAKHAQSGSSKAIDLLVKNHLLLVVKIARQYKGMGVELSDLIAEGNVGLIHSIGKWNSDKNSSFTTCASWWIKQNIIRNCMHNNRIVRLPENVSELMRSERIDYRYSEVHIDKPNDEGHTLSEILPDDVKFDIFISDEENLLKMSVNNFLQVLDKNEKNIIEMAFGLNGKEKFNSTQISERVGLTSTRVNQIIKKAIAKMKRKI